MCQPSRHCLAFNRRGISLLEVLIAMFVLAVGILSIFALFTAGRELEARASIKSQAISFAATLQATICNEWLDQSQWMHPTGVASPPSYATITPANYCLPVLVDPWALCSGTSPTDTSVAISGPASAFWPPPPNAAKWDWRQMAPLASGASVQPFCRMTLPAGGGLPLSREGVIASLSDQDAVEFKLTADQNSPPQNAFELGRRKRGSDLVPALFLGASGVTAASFAILPNTQVQRTLLIFHKPVPDFESNGSTDWPAGFVELSVNVHADGLIDASLTSVPNDLAVVRRSLRPANWLLLTKREGSSPPYYYSTKWTKMTSVTQTANDPSANWLIVVETDIDPVAPASVLKCYAFERLVHVVDVGPARLR